MINQIFVSEKNLLAIEVTNGFTEADEQLCQQLFQEKIAQGFTHINLLVKLDELKISQTSIKAFMEDTVWALRNYHHIGHMAIVAHSKVLKALVPIDNLFFQRASEGRLERYFDISQMEEAIKFVTP